ncbi:MAG: hypothetical protein V4733_01415 [Verrucomicrobiota bacterium]
MHSHISVLNWLRSTINRRLDAVFLGDYRPRLFIHICNLFQTRRVVLVDDGSISPEIAEFRNQYTNGAYQSSGVDSKHRNSGLRTMPQVRLDLAEPEAVEFFSFYRLKVPITDKLRRNYQDVSKLSAQHYTIENTIWLIGTNHVEERITNNTQYFNHLRKIAHFYRGQRIVYFSHRRESSAKLLDLQKLFGFELRSTDKGIESEILTHRILPLSIVTIVSTVTDSVSHIFGGDYPVDCFLPNERYFIGKRIPHINAVIEAQRANPEQGTRFWTFDKRFPNAGFIARHRFQLTDHSFCSSTQIKELPLNWSCTSVDSRGIFVSGFEVEPQIEPDGCCTFQVTDPSQPFLFADDEYFLTADQQVVDEIRVISVEGLTVSAKLLRNPSTRGEHIRVGRSFRLYPRFRSAEISRPSMPHPIGVSLGHGTSYLPMIQWNFHGIDVKLEGLKQQTCNGFIIDPWGKFITTRLAEVSKAGLHQVNLNLNQPLMKNEHLSFVVINGGRRNICIRCFDADGVIGIYYLDLFSLDAIQDTEISSPKRTTIAVDKLFGGWVRITLCSGVEALTEIQILLQPDFAAWSSHYLGSPARGIILHSIARAKSSLPSLPVIQEGMPNAGSEMVYQGLVAANLELVFCNPVRRFIRIHLNKVSIDFDLGPPDLPGVSCDSIASGSPVLLPIEEASGMTSNLLFSLDGKWIVAETLLGAARLIECEQDTFDLEIVTGELPENLCPFLAGIECVRNEIGTTEKKKLLHRRKLVPQQHLDLVHVSQDSERYQMS